MKRKNHFKLVQQLKERERHLTKSQEQFNISSGQIEDLKDRTLQDQKEANILSTLIKDFIHEQKKINERMNAAITQHDSAMDKLNSSYHNDDNQTKRLIKNTSLTMYSLSTLSNQRMELLEYQIAPEVFATMTPEKVYIYKEFEKLYKSINGGKQDQFKNFILKGESYAYCYLPRTISIGIFILLENAWKYSPIGKDIVINFEEHENTLRVQIINYGPFIKDDERHMLFSRGYRGENARLIKNISGKGLGLSIAKDIFNSCEVRIQIVLPDKEIEVYNDMTYGEFIVDLQFNPIIK